jgi:hypothetical protein
MAFNPNAEFATIQTNEGSTFYVQDGVMYDEAYNVWTDPLPEYEGGGAVGGGEDPANKDASGGYVGLTLLKINFLNALGTITSFFTNSNTEARTYTFQDRNGTIADDTDLALKADVTYVDGIVVGVLKDRGNYDASVNTFPASGGSGAAGAIKKGDLWYISVAGTLGSVAVGIGDTIRALADTPGQTASNWAVMENNLGYVPERSIDAATAKTTPVDADTMGIIDSAASNVLKKVTWANIKATLKAYFDTLYGAGWTTVASQSVGTGNDIVIPGLPAGWTEVLVKITGLSFDAAATQPLLQFVTSGGNIATGYSAYLATNTSMLPETTGIPVFWSSVAAVDLLKITVRIKRTGALTFEADGTSISAVRACVFLGDITLASEATGLRLKASGAVNMDGGNISVYAR